MSANSVDAHKVAITLVNRSPDDELAEVLLRDRVFDGPATIRTVTAAVPVTPARCPTWRQHS